jgi:hypothetical protein
MPLDAGRKLAWRRDDVEADVSGSRRRIVLSQPFEVPGVGAIAAQDSAPGGSRLSSFDRSSCRRTLRSSKRPTVGFVALDKRSASLAATGLASAAGSKPASSVRGSSEFTSDAGRSRRGTHPRRREENAPQQTCKAAGNPNVPRYWAIDSPAEAGDRGGCEHRLVDVLELACETTGARRIRSLAIGEAVGADDVERCAR